MDFIIKWVVFYVGVMFAMSIDNVFWIPTAPEYPQFKKMPLKNKINYILKDRILVVLKHPRDIIPAIITSFLLAVVL